MIPDLEQKKCCQSKSRSWNGDVNQIVCAQSYQLKLGLKILSTRFALAQRLPILSKNELHLSQTANWGRLGSKLVIFRLSNYAVRRLPKYNLCKYYCCRRVCVLIEATPYPSKPTYQIYFMVGNTINSNYMQNVEMVFESLHRSSARCVSSSLGYVQFTCNKIGKSFRAS